MTSVSDETLHSSTAANLRLAVLASGGTWQDADDVLARVDAALKERGRAAATRLIKEIIDTECD